MTAEEEAEIRAARAEERGQGICRTCLAPIWNEGGTIGHQQVAPETTTSCRCHKERDCPGPEAV